MKNKILVFDLDATLYYAGNQIEQLCDAKICHYFMNRLSMSESQALDLIHSIRQNYHYESDAIGIELSFSKPDFIEYICDVDVGILPPSPQLNHILKSIPNTKYILTDSTSKHVHDTLHQLGVDTNHFSGIFDAHNMQYIFKYNPQSYKLFLQKYGLNATDCIMFEDSYTNLEVAKSLGFSTVLIRPDAVSKPVYADYVFKDITTALKKLFF